MFDFLNVLVACLVARLMCNAKPDESYYLTEVLEKKYFLRLVHTGMISIALITNIFSRLFLPFTAKPFSLSICSP